MKNTFKKMDNQVNDMFNTIANATRPTTQEMNKGIDDLGEFVDVQMDKLNQVKSMTYKETQELTRNWIDAVGDNSHCDNDPRMRLAFTVGWMTTTIVDLLTSVKTPEDVVSDMERLTK